MLRGDNSCGTRRLIARCGLSLFASLLLWSSLLITVRAGQGALSAGQDARQRSDSGRAIQDEKEVGALEPGQPVERELAGDQAHYYQLTLSAGQYLHVVVDQRGIDVLVTLFGPDSRKVVEVDSPNGARGPEPLALVSEAAGSYRLEVRPLEKGTAGCYEIRVEAMRVATQQDKDRIAAERALAQGDHLRDQGAAESLKGAIDKYQEARSLFRAAGDRAMEATALRKIGETQLSLGDLQHALNHFNHALLLSQALRDSRMEAAMLLGIGLVYNVLGEHQKALDLLSQAQLLYRALEVPLGDAFALSYLGLVYKDLGEHQKALDHFNQALPLHRANSFRQGEALALRNIGMIYKETGEPQKALDYYDRALPLFQATGNRHEEAATLNNIGEAHDHLGEHQKALDYYHKALSMYRAVSYSRGEAHTLYGIAHAQRHLDNLGEARMQIEAALTIIESLRTKISSHELRASYFATAQDAHRFYIDLLMRLHKQRPSGGHDAEALQASERARARSLLELLAESRAQIRQGVDPLLLERERNLQLLLNAKADSQTRILGGTHTPEQAQAAAKEIAALTTEYQQVEAQIRQISPRYAALTQPRPLNLKEIQTQVLNSETLLLEYALGEHRSYLWAVTPTSLHSYELPKRTEIETTARRVYDLLTARNRRIDRETPEARRARVAQADAEYLTAAAELSHMLLGPVSAQLGKKRLLIVSDGALQFVPFAALPVPAAQGSGVGGQGPGNRSTNRPLATDYRPLIVEHEIVNLPSASTLAVLRRELRGRRPAAKAVAVLADPVFDETDGRVRASNDGKKTGEKSSTASELTSLHDVERNVGDLGDAGFSLPPRRLDASRWEAEQITVLVPARESMRALDFAANHATATGAELSQYRIVHFATHGFINSVHPELSGVVLSLVDEQGREQKNGFLRAHEIFNLQLPAELVVLSACRTGLGKEIKGEGLVGLTRGFMYAGAPRVVVSLWSVEDKTTAELMARFYRKMLGAERQTAAAALRSAQVEMWKEKRWGAAYHWAAFILQGEWK